MKRSICIIVLLFGYILSGCGQTSPSSVETELYILPNSYLKFSGMEVDEAVESCLELGNEYCTEAKAIPEGLQLELTQEQLDNLVLKNNHFIDELARKLTDSNNLYKYEPDENYQTLTLYFDENISGLLQIKTILGIASSYAMNYMLINHVSDWKIKIEIYNCHTNKLVCSVNIPGEEVTYGAKEWEESYKE